MHWHSCVFSAVDWGGFERRDALVRLSVDGNYFRPAFRRKLLATKRRNCLPTKISRGGPKLAPFLGPYPKLSRGPEKHCHTLRRLQDTQRHTEIIVSNSSTSSTCSTCDTSDTSSNQSLPSTASSIQSSIQRITCGTSGTSGTSSTYAPRTPPNLHHLRHPQPTLHTLQHTE